MQNLSQHCFHYKLLTKPHLPMKLSERDMLCSDVGQLVLKHAKEKQELSVFMLNYWLKISFLEKEDSEALLNSTTR